MKILIINDRLDMAGGAERYTVDVANGLAELGHEVVVVYGFGESQKLRVKSILVTNLETVSVIRETHQFKLDVVYVQNIGEPRLLEELAKIKPTVKFVHDHRAYCPGNSKMWFAAGKICPVAISWRCGWYAYRERCLTRHPKRLVENIVRRRGMLSALRKLPQVLCNSNYVRDRLLQNGLLADKVEVNPLFPGGEGGLLTRRVYDRPFGSVDVPEILFVGRVFIEKGVEYLLRAAALIKNVPFRVVVVGEGWDLDRCKVLAGDLGLGERVEFAGFLPRAEIDKYYARCRLLVIPSIWPEPFGMVGLEALACGKPVVAFDVGGIADWLKNDKAGFLVKRGNIDELSQRVRQLLTEESLAMKMGEAGRLLVQEKFTLERHLHQLLRIFQEISS